MPYFGLIDRFKESVCLLHYQTHMPWPDMSRDYCGERNINKNAKEEKKCVTNAMCVFGAVCPADSVDNEVNLSHTYTISFALSLSLFIYKTIFIKLISLIPLILSLAGTYIRHA